MNFLAHLYLSHNQPEVMIGNFIADTIKGNQFNQLPPAIVFGIKMHRAIDTFTDEHLIFRQSKNRLNPQYKLYKGVIIDIIYDHFLAKNWNLYHQTSLKNYSQQVYDLLYEHFDLLPDKAQYIIPYMTTQDWLYNYRTIDGIGNILYNMNKRTKGVSKMDEAIIDLQNHYSEFENDFTLFFKEVNLFAQNYLLNLNSISLQP